jgi:hypothetical protein
MKWVRLKKEVMGRMAKSEIVRFLRSTVPIPILFALPLFLALPASLPAQEKTPPTGWEFTGLPALNFDSDEGFGYGVILALYDYGSEGLLPYRLSLRPEVFFTTEGRRDLTLFLDAPHLFEGWRLSAFLGQENRIATPYYGLGNQSAYSPELETGDNPYYYRFGRNRTILRANLLRKLASWPLHIVVGGQIAHFTIDPTPKDEGSTLLLEELGPGVAVPGGSENSLRAGLVWDTRDRESGPGEGVWTEGLVEVVDEALGSDVSYVRWTMTDRRYFTLWPTLVFANRITLQNTTGSPPFYALTYVQSSFNELEALGGAKSLRGVLRNRYSGEGIFLWNMEIRWRAGERRLLGKDAYLALIGFFDSGRVWADGVEGSSLLGDLHHGWGGGARVGLGPNFVVATDLATSQGVGLQLYIGLGYLF